MPKRNYNKPALTLEQQLELLKSRGLIVEDKSKAIHILQTISYYRLSAYWYPMLKEPQTDHIFKPGSNFKTAFIAYCFDKDLRKLIISEIEKLEVSIRAKIIYTLSHADSPFWFRNNFLFKDIAKHSACLENIEAELNRSNEVFINMFKENYLNLFPPSWILMEVTSFGTLSTLYSNLKTSPEKTEIAKSFGLSVNVFTSWLHTLVFIRNICAHHGRIWNRVMNIPPKKVKSPHFEWITDKNVSSNNCYYILCVIKYFLNVTHKKNKFTEKLKFLLAKYPSIDIAQIGFSVNWSKEPLWKSNNLMFKVILKIFSHWI